MGTQNDGKRFYRNLKKHVKKVGNRKRRKYLKDFTNSPDDFRFDEDASKPMNGRDYAATRHKPNDLQSVQEVGLPELPSGNQQTTEEGSGQSLASGLQEHMLLRTTEIQESN